MSVFLRWGIFGILGFAGLMYAYNASKQLAARHAGGAAPSAVETSAVEASAVETRAVESAAVDAVPPAAPAPEVHAAPAAPPPNAPPHCEAELVVAQRALAARAEGQPLDRLLRIQEIAFQEPVRRERLQKVATYWFNFEGPAPVPEGLRIGVISDCIMTSPAP